MGLMPILTKVVNISMNPGSGPGLMPKPGHGQGTPMSLQTVPTVTVQFMCDLLVEGHLFLLIYLLSLELVMLQLQIHQRAWVSYLHSPSPQIQCAWHLDI